MPSEQWWLEFFVLDAEESREVLKIALESTTQGQQIRAQSAVWS